MISEGNDPLPCLLIALESGDDGRMQGQDPRGAGFGLAHQDRAGFGIEVGEPEPEASARRNPVQNISPMMVSKVNGRSAA